VEKDAFRGIFFTKNIRKILTYMKSFGIIYQYDIVQMYLNEIHTQSD